MLQSFYMSVKILDDVLKLREAINRIIGYSLYRQYLGVATGKNSFSS